jgi:hypothetical protein
MRFLVIIYVLCGMRLFLAKYQFKTIKLYAIELYDTNLTFMICFVIFLTFIKFITPYYYFFMIFAYSLQ